MTRNNYSDEGRGALNTSGSVCTTCFSITKLRILPKKYIFVFRMILRINNYSFLKHH
jgi:hypothetical protein